MFCSFCNNEIAKGEGTMFVYRNGTTAVFCSSKCKRNLLNLKREGRLKKWTQHGIVLEVHKKAEKKESAAAKEIGEKLAAKKAAETKKK